MYVQCTYIFGSGLDTWMIILVMITMKLCKLPALLADLLIFAYYSVPIRYYLSSVPACGCLNTVSLKNIQLDPFNISKMPHICM